MSSSNEIYYPWFDWLRFTLAMTVMLSHFGMLKVWQPAGDFAVQVFFALSGWLIGGILIRSSRADLPRFYFNRAIRIWAPYYLALLFLVTASLLKHNVVDAKWLEFVGYKLTFVYNLFGPPQLAKFKEAMPLAGTGNHFWSVNAEEQFYLLAPAVLVLAAPLFGRKPVTWLAIAIVAWIADIYASIVFGVLAAVVQSRYPGFHLKPLSRLTLLAVVVISAVLFSVTAQYRYITPFCGIAVVLLLALQGRRTRFGELAGGLSYPLYLNHWIGGFVATVLLIPFGLRYSLVQVLLGVVLSVSLAAALYWWMERPMLAKRSALYTPGRGWLVMGVAYSMVALGLVFAAVAQRASQS